MNEIKKNDLDEILSSSSDLEGKDKTRAEQVLVKLEHFLKQLINEKKALKSRFKSKFQNLEKWFNEEWKEANKLENKVILIWDYWKREVEILNCQKQLAQQVSSTDRQEITKKLDQLVLSNAGLERGLKERQIDPAIIEQLRKKLGVWEE